MLARLFVVVALLGTPLAHAADEIDAAPRKASGANPTYPRLTRLADASVLARVNQLLAGRETDDRASRDDCLRQIREAKQKPDRQSFTERTEVTFLSARYLSVDVHQSYSCATAYPTNDSSNPVTYDLTTGDEVDWESVFKPGFLPAEGLASELAKLYRARYRVGDESAEECRSVIADDDVLFRSTPSFRLDARRGLVVQPQFPHAIEACAEEVGLSGGDVAPFLDDAALLAAIRSAAGRR